MQDFAPAVTKVLNSIGAFQAAVHGPVTVSPSGAAQTQCVIAPKGGKCGMQYG